MGIDYSTVISPPDPDAARERQYRASLERINRRWANGTPTLPPVASEPTGAKSPVVKAARPTIAPEVRAAFLVYYDGLRAFYPDLTPQQVRAAAREKFPYVKKDAAHYWLRLHDPDYRTAVTPPGSKRGDTLARVAELQAQGVKRGEAVRRAAHEAGIDTATIYKWQKEERGGC